MNFGRAERVRYKKYMVPIYGNFLQKCYCRFFRSFSFHDALIDFVTVAPDECRARALAPEEGFEGLETIDFEADGANFDIYDVSKTSTPAEPVTSFAGVPQRPDVEINLTDELPVSASRPSSLPPSRPVSPPPSPPVSLPPSRPVSPPPSPPISLPPSHPVSPPGSPLPSTTSQALPMSNDTYQPPSITANSNSPIGSGKRPGGSLVNPPSKRT